MVFFAAIASAVVAAAASLSFHSGSSSAAAAEAAVGVDIAAPALAFAAASPAQQSRQLLRWRPFPSASSVAAGSIAAGRLWSRRRLFLRSNNQGSCCAAQDSRRRSSLLSLSSSLSSSSDEDENAEEQRTENEWTLEEDWALLDAVPKYTVVADDNGVARTFWSQLSASTPVLSGRKRRRTPADCYRRCRKLCGDGDGRADDRTNRKNSEKKKKATIKYGPSPPVLHNWQMAGHNGDDDIDIGNSNFLVGQTDDGRTVWFRYRCIGRFEDDPFVDLFKSARRNTASSVRTVPLNAPGGYVEAVGGGIYELGLPNPSSSASAMSSSSEPAAREENGNGNRGNWLLSPTSLSVGATMTAFLAFVASAFISASIGYGAGLLFVSDDHSSTSLKSSSPVSTPTTTLVQQQQVPTTATAAVSASTAIVPYSKYDAPSLQEQKSRLEYRVLREQRLILKIFDQMERDETQLRNLQQLQRLEQQQQ